MAPVARLTPPSRLTGWWEVAKDARTRLRQSTSHLEVSPVPSGGVVAGGSRADLTSTERLAFAGPVRS